MRELNEDHLLLLLLFCKLYERFSGCSPNWRFERVVFVARATHVTPSDMMMYYVCAQ